MIIATEAQIFRYRETHFYMKHTHRIIISHFLLPLTHFTEDWWIQLWSERCRNRAMDNYGVTLACSILFFLIFFLIFFFFWEDANIARSSNQQESQHRFPWTMSCEHDHKTDHDDDSEKDDDHSRREEKNKKQTTKLLSSRSLVIGQ